MTKSDLTSPSVLLEAGRSTEVALVSPRMRSRLVKIVIPDDAAPHLLVTDVKVGKISQLLSAGAVPAELFAESGPRFNFDWDHMEPGEVIRVSVRDMRSKSEDPLPFSFRVELGRSEGASYGKACVGYGSTTVEKSVIVHVQPQVRVVPTHLFLQAAVAKSYRVTKVTARGVDLEATVNTVYGIGTDQSSCYLLRGPRGVRVEAPAGEFLSIHADACSMFPPPFQAAVVGDRAQPR